MNTYLTTVSEDRREVVARLRALCLGELPGFEERFRYGMPSYVRDGIVEVAFASQKSTINIYILRTDVMIAHRDALASLDTGKGAIRFRPNAVDLDLIRSLLAATAASTGPVC